MSLVMVGLGLPVLISRPAQDERRRVRIGFQLQHSTDLVVVGIA